MFVAPNGEMAKGAVGTYFSEFTGCMNKHVELYIIFFWTRIDKNNQNEQIPTSFLQLWAVTLIRGKKSIDDRSSTTLAINIFADVQLRDDKWAMATRENHGGTIHCIINLGHLEHQRKTSLSIRNSPRVQLVKLLFFLPKKKQDRMQYSIILMQWWHMEGV